MSKQDELRRGQREFLFVISGKTDGNVTIGRCWDVSRHDSNINLADDLAKSHRDKLIAELREFGC